MSYTNWKISFKQEKPTFYTTEKTPTKGYKKNDWEFGNKTGTNYRKDVDEISGKLVYVGFDEFESENGKVRLLKITLEDGDTNNVLQLNVDDTYGLAEYFKSAVLSLGNLTYGMETTVSLNTDKLDKRGYPYKSIYFDKVKFTFNPQSDAPAWTKVKKAGKDTWDRTEHDDFYYTKAEEGIKSFLDSKPSSNTPKPEPVDESGFSGNDDDLSLPF